MPHACTHPRVFATWIDRQVRSVVITTIACCRRSSVQWESAKPWFEQLSFSTILIVEITQVTAGFLCYSGKRVLLTPMVPYLPVAMFMAERHTMYVHETGLASTVVYFPHAFHPLWSTIGSLCLPGANGLVGSADDVVSISVQSLILPCLRPSTHFNNCRNQVPRTFGRAVAVEILKLTSPSSHSFPKWGMCPLRGGGKKVKFRVPVLGDATARTTALLPATIACFVCLIS